MTVYLVNYGRDRQHYLSTDKRFTNKQEAFREAASSVRELGTQSWAKVSIEDPKGEMDTLLAFWDQGRRRSLSTYYYSAGARYHWKGDENE